MDIKKIMMGTAFFIIGYIFVAITQWMFPYLIDAVDTLGMADSLQGILWFGVIIVWIIALVVLPIAFIVWGLMKYEQSQNPMLNITFAVLWSVFTLAITYFTYFWLPILAAALEYQILIALFWVGIVVILVTNVIIAPTYVIVQAKRG